MARGGGPKRADSKRAWVVAGVGAASAIAAVALLSYLHTAPPMVAGLERGVTPSPEVAAPAEQAPPSQAPSSSRHAEHANVDAPSEMGEASWYEFDGEDTANGEIMDGDRLTAAHPTLPPGTRVLVENVENGQRVVVRINDRGPFTAGRIIDVSKAAAEQLDMIKDGIATVRVWRVAVPGHEPVSFF